MPPEAAAGRTNPGLVEVVAHLLGQADVFAGRQGDFSSRGVGMKVFTRELNNFTLC